RKVVHIGKSDGVLVEQPISLLSNCHNDAIADFVKVYYHLDSHQIKRENDVVIVTTLELMCPQKGKPHRSNHQFIVIGPSESVQKCHDDDCKGKRHLIIPARNYPNSVKEIFTGINSNEVVEKIITDSEVHTAEYIRSFYDSGVKSMKYNTVTKSFNAP